MDIARKAAGWAIIAAGSGLAAISGVLAYNGFENMISIPFAGWIGPCVAASLIGLGIAVESEIRARRWIGAAILGLLLIGAGMLDRHSGELALTAKVEAAAQVAADRKAGFDMATKALAASQEQIAAMQTELALMTGDDIKGAQLKLAGLGLYRGKIDGERGPVTLQAMADRGNEIRNALPALRNDERAQSAIVAKGAPASKMPFSLSDAALYASLITLLSIILAFAGSYVAHGVKKEPTAEEALSEIEEVTTELEAEVFDLAAYLASHKRA
jgi:hypothetical protein